MEPSKVDMFLIANGELLPSARLIIVRENLLAASDSKWPIISLQTNV